MRNYIDIINQATENSTGSVRDLDQARQIFIEMSPIKKYRLLDQLPYIRLDQGGWDARYKQAVEYIAAHLDEFTKPE